MSGNLEKEAFSSLDYSQMGLRELMRHSDEEKLTREYLATFAASLTKNLLTGNLSGLKETLRSFIKPSLSELLHEDALASIVAALWSKSEQQNEGSSPEEIKDRLSLIAQHLVEFSQNFLEGSGIDHTKASITLESLKKALYSSFIIYLRGYAIAPRGDYPKAPDNHRLARIERWLVEASSRKNVEGSQTAGEPLMILRLKKALAKKAPRNQAISSNDLWVGNAMFDSRKD